MAYELGIIGGGNMGGAVLRGALRANVIEPAAVIIADLDSERRAAFAELGVSVTADARAATEADALMLAVKPQGFSAVAASIAPLARPTIVLSVMAGLDSSTLRAALGEHARIVRVMPNTPSRIGAGVSAIALGEGARPGDDDLAVRLFESVGDVVRVDESQMHAVTATSGSGPAYVFLLAEAMQAAAESAGLPADTAARLVQTTIYGAARLMRESGETPAELRAAVTSKGGTTQAALDVLVERGMPEAVHAAIMAARDRGIELGRS